jgi:predicted ATPase
LTAPGERVERTPPVAPRAPAPYDATMLTRVEIDGFKSFEGFALDLPPFVVILGANAAGKSNLFDALRLLSNLATMDVRGAMRELRGEPHELFRTIPGHGPVERMRLAVELLLPPKVRDAFGQELELACTRIRYEVELERRTVGGIERVFVVRESANPIRKNDDRWRPLNRAPSKTFRDAFVRYTSRATAFLQTAYDTETAQQILHVHQDRKQGRIRKVPIREAESTILASTTLASEFLHLFAIREELSSLRYLQLEPEAERKPAPLDSRETLERDGSNLAAVLYRIEHATKNEQRPHGWLTDIRNDLSSLVPGVVDIHVERDDARREYRLDIETRDRQRFSSRVASDGTLRVLSLLALLNDPRHRGTLCFEEPENGINPRRLTGLMHYLRDACAPVHADDVEAADPRALQQIIVNTHSIVAARAVKDEIVLAQMATVIDDAGPRTKTTMRPVTISAQGAFDYEPERPRPVSHAELESIFSAIENDELAAA